jgi:hypothetical protein
MSADVTRDEFNHLEGRVSVVEQEVEGEKLVTRYILDQTRRNGDDLAVIKRQLEGVDLKGLVRKVGGLDKRVGGLEGRFGGLEKKVDDLTKNLPGIVAEAMRKVLRERDG